MSAFVHGGLTERPYTSLAASRTIAGPMRCCSCVNAPSNARSQITLMMRGMPSLSRCTSRNAAAEKTSPVAEPATRNAMIHIRGGLGARQRGEVIAAGNALSELAQLDAREHFAQLGLADQDDLQQLLRRRLQVREQPHLLQRFGREVLRLVDDHDDAPALGMRFQQAMVEHVERSLMLSRPRRA